MLRTHSSRLFRVIVLLGASALPSTAFAGFTVTATRTQTSGAFDIYSIIAVNTGGGTGTQIKGLEYDYSGPPAYFEVNDVDEDGTPDTVNFNSSSRTRIRLNNAAFNNVYVGQTPASSEIQPNAYATPISAFSGAIANTGTTQASGTGYQIARLFVQTGGIFQFRGNIGGEVGTKVPFSVGICRCSPPPMPFISSNPGTTVVFGSTVSTPLPFSGQVTVTAPEWAGPISLSVDAIPSTVSNVVITGGGTGAATFTISGLVRYAGNGVIYLPISAYVGNPANQPAVGVFAITVTPEPTSMLAMSAALLAGMRRRWPTHAAPIRYAAVS